jgi:hypothetical protein
VFVPVDWGDVGAGLVAIVGFLRMAVDELRRGIGAVKYVFLVG